MIYLLRAQYFLFWNLSVLNIKEKSGIKSCKVNEWCLLVIQHAKTEIEKNVKHPHKQLNGHAAPGFTYNYVVNTPVHTPDTQGTEDHTDQDWNTTDKVSILITTIFLVTKHSLYDSKVYSISFQLFYWLKYDLKDLFLKNIRC